MFVLNGNPYSGWKSSVARDLEYPTRGTLGYFIDGQFRILVPGRPAYYYVRFDNFSYREVPHKGRVGVPSDLNSYAAQNIAVRLGFDLENEYSILGFRSSAEANNVINLFGGAILNFPHTHPIAAMDWIGTKTLSAGRILLSDGTQYNSVPLSAIAGAGLVVSDDQLTVEPAGSGVGNILVSLDGEVLVSLDGYVLEGIA